MRAFWIRMCTKFR